MKRHSLALQVKFQVDALLEQLRRTRIHFVHCFLPQHNAGLCDVKLKQSLQQQGGDSNEILINVPLVRSQVLHVQRRGDYVALHNLDDEPCYE